MSESIKKDLWSLILNVFFATGTKNYESKAGQRFYEILSNHYARQLNVLYQRARNLHD